MPITIKVFVSDIASITGGGGFAGRRSSRNGGPSDEAFISREMNELSFFLVSFIQEENLRNEKIHLFKNEALVRPYVNSHRIVVEE